MIRYTFGVVLLSVVMIMSSCSKKGCTDIDSINFDIEAEKDDGTCTLPSLRLHIHPTVGGETFVAGDVYTINGVKTQIDRIQYYVSDISIADDDGNEYEPTTNLALADATKHHIALGEGKAGHAHKVKFGIGVPADLNTQIDPSTYDAENPLANQSPSMHWSWDAGYKFFVMEGMVDTDGDDVVDSLLEIHIGGDLNYVPVEIELHTDVDSADKDFELEADFAKVFNGLDPAVDNVTHVMDNVTLANAVKANLATIITAE